MLFSSSESSGPGKLDGVLDFILKSAEKVNTTLALEIYTSLGM